MLASTRTRQSQSARRVAGTYVGNVPVLTIEGGQASFASPDAGPYGGHFCWGMTGSARYRDPRKRTVMNTANGHYRLTKHFRGGNCADYPEVFLWMFSVAEPRRSSGGGGGCRRCPCLLTGRIRDGRRFLGYRKPVGDGAKPVPGAALEPLNDRIQDRQNSPGDPEHRHSISLCHFQRKPRREHRKLRQPRRHGLG